VFLVNSRYPRFSATPKGSWREARHPQGHTLSRSYGVNLPSSLTRVLSSALGCSPHPPVSVYGTVSTAVHLCDAFLGSLDSSSCPPCGDPHHLSAYDRAFVAFSLLRSPPTGLNDHPSGRSTILLRPISQNHPCWCRNIRLLPIDYAFLPRLRDRLTLRR
jgi:hypothetical protein